MDERQTTACLLRFQYLVDNLSTRYLLPQLIQDDVITEEEAQQVNSHSAENDKLRSLLAVLISSRKPDIFVRFLKSLSAADWGFVAVELWNTYQTASERLLQLPPPNPSDWLARLGSSGSQIVDDDILVESVSLVANYKTYAVLLGFTTASLVQLELQHPHLSERILKMLMTWKRSEGRNATLMRHVQLFRLAGVDDDALRTMISKNLYSQNSLGNALV